MNLFASDPCPCLSAQALDDKRVVKMALETAQLLSTAVHHGMVFASDEVYRPAYANHPVAIWVRSHPDALLWSYQHLHWLCVEYHFRFKRQHACERVLQALVMPPGSLYKRVTPDFCNCTPYPELPVHGAYRHTLRLKWANDKRPPTWRVRGAPLWYQV